MQIIYPRRGVICQQELQLLCQHLTCIVVTMHANQPLFITLYLNLQIWLYILIYRKQERSFLCELFHGTKDHIFEACGLMV